MFRSISRTPFSGPIHEKGLSLKNLSFKVGDVFKGRVAQCLARGEILLSARGKQFSAHTNLALQEGQSYRFQVRSLGARVELKVQEGNIEGRPSQLGDWAALRANRKRLVHLLTDLASTRNTKSLSPEAGKALAGLKNLLPSILFNEPDPEGGKWLMRNIMSSGLFWESKAAKYLLGGKEGGWRKLAVKDLKGLLLTLNRELTKQGVKDEAATSLTLKIREAVHIIEQDQFFNLSALRDGAGWFILLPGLQENGFRRAEVFVENNPEEGAIRFFMSVGFTDLGQMEAAISILQSVIHAQILLEDEERASFVSRHLSLLEKGLEKGGLTIGEITCGVREESEEESYPFPDDLWSPKPVDLVI